MNSEQTIRQQILIQDGNGNRLPILGGTGYVAGYPVGIGTGVWAGPAICMDRHRRLSITMGIGSATGAAGDVGGFTGTLAVQGTDELEQCNGFTGTQEAGNTKRPGINGATGARFWQTLASGLFNVTNATASLLIQFTDVGVAFVRVVFNANSSGQPSGPGVTGTLGGSGTMYVYLTAKNT